MAVVAGQVINNRYRVTALLGKGNFGAVYYAWDLNLNSPVAVKELRSTTPVVTQQFTLEARTLANLRHPNLPYVIDQFTLPGSGQYLVMEFAEGEDLQSLINRTGRGIPEAQVFRWIAQVCEALTFLHSQSPAIIHRDVKPANIRIASDGKAMLVDFGITRASDPARRTTVFTGGPEEVYIPPELLTGATADSAAYSRCCDIYSLGATLYTALVGATPPSALRRQAGQVLLPLRQFNSTITARTEAAIMRAMELAPERRYQSVGEFVAALGLSASGDVVPPTQVVQRYAPQQYTAESIPPTVQVKPALPIGYEPLSPPRQKESKSWIIWVVVILSVVCLFGGITTGVGLYTVFYATGTPTPTLSQTALSTSTEDQAATQTAIVSQSTSPAPPTTAFVPDTLTPTPIPSWTSTSTFPPSPTFTPSMTPPPSPTVPPVVNPTWQPCPGAFPSRLHVGNRAYVSHDPPLANRVRTQPNTGSAILGFIQPGEKMKIIDGPACSDQWIWWQVRSLDTGLTGWTAEGDNQTYWLVPLP